MATSFNVEPLTPGSPEWKSRLSRLLAEEMQQPLRLFYLSFSDGEFLGACIVEARGSVSAQARALELGINPGGQAMAVEIPPDAPVPSPEIRNRLLSKADLDAAFREQGGMRHVTVDSMEDER